MQRKARAWLLAVVLLTALGWLTWDNSTMAKLPADLQLSVLNQVAFVGYSPDTSALLFAKLEHLPNATASGFVRPQSSLTVTPKKGVLVVYLALKSVSSPYPGDTPAHNLNFFLRQHALETRASSHLYFIAPREVRWSPGSFLNQVSSRLPGTVLEVDAGNLTVVSGLSVVVEAVGGIDAVQRLFEAVVVVTDGALGPFVPVFIRREIGWDRLLASQLEPKPGGVHLVVPSVRGGDERSQSRQVDATAFATDTTFGLPAILHHAPGFDELDVWSWITMDGGRVALINAPCSQLVAPSAYDTMFARTVDPWYPLSQVTKETNILLAKDAWKAAGRMGLPNSCPPCVEEPAPGVAPAEWSAYLVDTEIHQATVTIGMRPWTLQPNDLLVQDVAPLQCAPQVPKREPKDFLCMYVFAGTTVGAMENLGYFLTFGIDPNSASIDYVIIIIDIPNRILRLPDSLLQRLAAVGELSNVEVMHRKNVGLDFCSYAEAVARLGGLEAILRLYKYFLFINETVRGPFLPTYYKKSSRARERKWYHLLSASLEQKRASLSGVYVSAQHTIHVQSMVFVVDREGLELVNMGMVCMKDKQALIRYAELGGSARILLSGTNVAGTIAALEDFDFLNQFASVPNDHHNPTASFYGVDLLPNELMFVKCAGDVLLHKWKRHDGGTGVLATHQMLERVDQLTDWAYFDLARSTFCRNASSMYEACGAAAATQEAISQPGWGTVESRSWTEFPKPLPKGSPSQDSELVDRHGGGGLSLNLQQRGFPDPGSIITAGWFELSQS